MPWQEGGVLGDPYLTSTDEYVRETELTYVVGSDIIRVEGNPYKEIIPPPSSEHPTHVPLVSPSRYNQVTMSLPDMNKMQMAPTQTRLTLDTELSVWKLVGIKVESQGAIRPPVTGNRFTTAAVSDSGLVQPTPGPNPPPNEEDEDEESLSSQPPPSKTPATTSWFEFGFEHTQVQSLTVGCEPPLGVYEARKSASSASAANIHDDNWYFTERMQTAIQDGDFCNFGFGNAHPNLQMDLSQQPVESVLNPNMPHMDLDLISMDNDLVGNKNFYTWKREAAGTRHTRLNPDSKYPNFPVIVSKGAPAVNNNDPFGYCHRAPGGGLSLPTAGMASSTTDLFNRYYWLNKSGSPNNSVIWGNKLWITFVDNLRGTIHNCSNYDNSAAAAGYDPEKSTNFLRHVKEFKITCLVRLCKVTLEAKLITYLLQYNHQWLKDLGFSFDMAPRRQPAGVSGQITMAHMSEPYTEAQEETNEEAEVTHRSILVDCSGHASLTPSHQSPHPLARAYHAAVGVPSMAPPKQPVKRAAAPGKGKGPAKGRKL
ncbi:L1 [Wesgulfec papillomavirus]|nr:L1 [Wesgulfec papillomavirus]